MTGNQTSQAGYTLIEMIIVIAIVGTILLVMVPSFSTMQKRAAVRAAAQEIRGIFHLARSRAIAAGRFTALKFYHDNDTWMWNLYEDGDFDGVQTADIESGVDRKISGPHRVLNEDGKIRISMPNFSLADPDTNKPLGPEASPVRFGKSKLCSFSPRGSSSSGTIFLTDGHQLVSVVRVFGPTARIRTMIFDPAHGTWSGQ